MTCPDCGGARAVPDDVSSGYAPCPSCVIEVSAPIVIAGWLGTDHRVVLMLAPVGCVICRIGLLR